MVHDTFTELLLSVEGRSIEQTKEPESVGNIDMSFGYDRHYDLVPAGRIESTEYLTWLSTVRSQLMKGVPRGSLARVPRRKGKLHPAIEAWQKAEDSGDPLPELPSPKKRSERTEWEEWKIWIESGGLANYNSEYLPVGKRGKITTPVSTPEGMVDAAKASKTMTKDDVIPVATDDGTISVKADSKGKLVESNPWSIYEEIEPDRVDERNPLILRPKIEFDDSPHCRWDVYDKFIPMRATREKFEEMREPSPYSQDPTREFEEWYCRISNMRPSKKYTDAAGNVTMVQGLVDPNIETRDDASDKPRLKFVKGIRIPRARAGLIFINLLHGNPLNFAGKPGTGKTQMARRIAAVRGGCMVFIPPLGEEAEGDLLGEWNTAKQIVAIEQAKIAAERLRIVEAEIRSTSNPLTRDSLLRRQKLLEDQIALGADPYNIPANWEQGGIEKALRGRYNPVTGEPEGCLCVVDEVNRYGYTTQNRLLHVTDQNEIVIPIKHTRVGKEHGFGMIVTTNEDDMGVKEMSGALQRRFQTVIFDTPDYQDELRIIGLQVDGQTTPSCKSAAEVLVKTARKLRDKFGNEGPTTAEVVRAYRALTGKPKDEDTIHTKLYQWEEDSKGEQCFMLYDTPEIRETIASFLTKKSDHLDDAMSAASGFLEGKGISPKKVRAKEEDDARDF